MPLFRRADGVLIKDVSPERYMLSLLMKGRNESAVYHQAVYDISKTRQWLRRFNRAGAHQAATIFHLFLWAVARGLHGSPNVNRFIAGGRLYQRKTVDVSFVAKRVFTRDAPFLTVKLPFREANEPLPMAVDRIIGAINDGRSGNKLMVDKELELATRLPRFFARFVMWLMQLLDRWNLLPAKLIESDPLYSSILVANLGSVGLDDSFHHLYEWGTTSLFAALGPQKKAPLVGRNGQVEVRDVMQVGWTLDERVADGFMGADGLRMVRDVMEDPEKFLGKPEQAAAGAAPVALAREEKAA
jgi:hypothetical protein